MSKPTPHKHVALIKAWAEGAAIEYRYPEDDTWYEISKPAWIEKMEYRIKPASPREFWIVPGHSQWCRAWTFNKLVLAKKFAKSQPNTQPIIHVKEVVS